MKHVFLPKVEHYAHFTHRDRMRNPYPLKKIGWKKTFVPPAIVLPIDTSGNGKVSCPMDGNNSLGDCGIAMACMLPGTLIKMANGSSKIIEDIKTLDKILTAEGTESYVTGTMVRHHEGELIKILAWGHAHLRCTPEHPIFTRRGYVAAGKLKKGDWIALPSHKIDQIYEIKIDKYITEEKMHYVESTNTIGKSEASKSRIIRSYIDFAIRFPEGYIELTPEFGRIIGLFLAEGSTNQNIVRWTFNQNEEDTLVTELINLLCSELGIYATYAIREGKGSIDVTVCSKILKIFFESLCGKGAANKTLHPDLMNGPKEFLEAIFQGWIDGDGNMMIDNRRKDYQSKIGNTVSRKLAHDMFSIAQAIGLNPIIAVRKPGKPSIYKGRKIISKYNRWTVTLREPERQKIKSSNYNGVSWDIKAQKWYAYGCLSGTSYNLGLYDNEDEAGKIAANWRKKNNILGNGMSHREGNIIYRCIRGIKRENYVGNVFNFSVAKEESYIAEGIGVHNCHAFNIWTYGQGHPDFKEVVFDEKALVAQYKKVSGGDNGLDEDEVVNQIEKVGVAGNKEMIITSALDIDVTNIPLAQWVIDNFYSIQMAWSVPDKFINNFAHATVWPDKMIPNDENGHFSLLSDVGGNGPNKIEGFNRLWTWGSWCWVSPKFIASVEPQCFITFSPRQFNLATGFDSKGRHITTQAKLWAECGGNPVPINVIDQFPSL